jgi:hypothetical protein
MKEKTKNDLIFEDRFLESWAGTIITNPTIAIAELVANCWDAYATKIDIIWPDSDSDRQFSIKDDGVGMTLDEFEYIWRALSYDRIKRYGPTAFPPDGTQGIPRPVFGKNGKGRFATFCFSNEYQITSQKNGERFSCIVSRTIDKPIKIEILEHSKGQSPIHGTEIKCTGNIQRINTSEKLVREFLGSRFLANPSFKVTMNGDRITFNDISKSCISNHPLKIEEIGEIEILHISTTKADKTTKQHGIAWWVLGRAVGECKWRGSDYQRILDGRTSEAKRYTFIVKADLLNNSNSVKEDWSWFKEDNETWLKVREASQDKIKNIILENDKEERKAKRDTVREKIGPSVNKLSPMSKDRIETFINEVVDNCPNFGEQEIYQLTSILAKLEKTKSRYGILEILHNQNPDDIDSLHEVLTQWSIGMAKIVLDEIQNRLKLISELKIKLNIDRIDELRELQPLFEKGLWMFGPQFESIEFTSNRGMTTIIRELFKDKNGKGSLNRPDFVVIPDGSVGFYARSSYDDDFNENGFEHVIIIDIKTTKLPIGSTEKEQVWKYIKELKSKGYIKKSTKVDGFVLGNEIEQGEDGTRTEDDNSVKIMPMLYDTILNRAEKRLLNLHSKVQEAPFLVEQKEQLSQFLSPITVKQNPLPDGK